MDINYKLKTMVCQNKGNDLITNPPLPTPPLPSKIEYSNNLCKIKKKNKKDTYKNARLNQGK